MRTKTGYLHRSERVTDSDMVPSKDRPTLTVRDQSLLADLIEFRYLTTAQVARLHFGNIKLAQRRLRRLHSAGLVVRAPSQEGARAGFHEWTYAAVPGRRRTDPAAPDASAPVPLKDPSRGFRLRYADHHRALTDVRIWLREAAARPDAPLACRFLPGYAEMRRDGRRTRVAAINVGVSDGFLVPDGVVVLSRLPGTAALLFLEVDRGTEPLRGKHTSSVFRKLEMYRKTYDGGLYAPFAEFFDYDFSGFRVAVVAPDQTRASRILEVADSADLTPLVWATPDSTMQTTGDFSAPVWQDAPEGELHSLLE